MMSYVAQISSIYPIDLTACLFHSVLDEDVPCRIFITDTFYYPDGPSRQFIARGALPLAQWSYTGPARWQQSHLPIIADDASHLRTLLSKVGESYAAVAGCPVIDGRAVDLARQASVVPGRFAQPWAAVTAGLVQTIFEACRVRCRGIEPFYAQREGAAKGVETERAALELLSRLPGEGNFELPPGARVELMENSQWLGFKSVARAGDFVTFQIDGGGSREYAALHLRGMRWRFRGAVEMFLLREHGTLVDLPWYSEDHRFDDDQTVDGVEVISPIHVVDPGRRHESCRLSPTGYTLIEYDHPIVRDFVSGVLRCGPYAVADLTDVERLLRLPPRVSQRLTKSQGAVRAYRHDMEEFWRRRLMAGAGLVDLQASVHPLRLGEGLTLRRVMLTLLKEHTGGHLDLQSRPNAWRALQGTGLVNDSGEICKAGLISAFEADRRRCVELFRLHGRAIDVSTADLDESLGIPKMLASLREKYRALAEEYYAWLAFMLAGPLKAHLLALYLLVGTADIRTVIGDLIARRSRAVLPFKLAPWRPRP